MHLRGDVLHQPDSQMCTFTIHLLPVPTDDLTLTPSGRACVGLSSHECAVGFQEVALTR